MKSLFLSIFLLLSHLGYSQTFPVLEAVLAKEFPVSSKKDGRWVFDPEPANIQPIASAMLKSRFSTYEFFQLKLNKHKGYHVKPGTCVVLFDRGKSNVLLLEPLEYNGVNEAFLKLCLKQQFDNQEELLTFVGEMHGLMGVGSGYGFVPTKDTDDLLTYDLVYFEGESFTAGGMGNNLSISYNQDEIWRKIEIEVKGLKMKTYSTINPVMKRSRKYKEKEYKKTIK